jgi:hypothetical protein
MVVCTQAQSLSKSTELRCYGNLLSKTYSVRHLELTKLLDINNLRYSDLVIAQAHSLVQAFADLSLQPDAALVNPVVNWFQTRIVTQQRFKEIDAELKTQANAKTGLAFIASFMAEFTAKIRTGATYKDELRTEVSNGFTQLSQALNALTAHANELLSRQGKGPLLFIIDGTDKMTFEDSTKFFEGDINQLWNIQTNVIICAPISVLLERTTALMRFDALLRLPMLKIVNRDGSPIKATEDALIELVAKRIPLSFFQDDASHEDSTLRYLVRISGGHPRDLLKLIHNCFSASPIITRAIAGKAAKRLATEYQRAIEKDDWKELVAIDRSHGKDIEKTAARMRMLFSLLLLEYNSYWWRSHPLVQSLEGYQAALSEHAS